MKKLAKRLVAAKLGSQVRKLHNQNDFKVIGVVGSIGKTSTKLAIAQTLAAKYRVQYQQGNYNDIVTVPLVFFGEETPSLFNPLAWLGVFRRNQAKLKQAYPYDVVVVEIGSDTPGLIEEFNSYLRLEIAVITALTPEHMLTFGNLDAVAEEELTVAEYSSLILANKDLCGQKYLSRLPELLTYGLKQKADYGADMIGVAGQGKPEAQQYSLLAAAAVGRKLGMTDQEIQKGLSKVEPFSGRMQELNGLNGALLIDDSYNSSPAAAELALDYLYAKPAASRIAVLGNMNEMGDYSEQAHKQIGAYCDPSKLSLVVTIGPDANKYLAPAARDKGCKVHDFDDPYAAGEFIKPLLKSDTVVLLKGSQNGVFAEETVKLLLNDPADAKKLVRQSPDWLAKKKKAFGR